MGLQKSQSDITLGLPRWCGGKESACNAGDTWDVISGSGRSPGVGNGNPPQYSCLKTPMGREAYGAIARGVAKSQISLSNWACSLHSRTWTPTTISKLFLLLLRSPKDLSHSPPKDPSVMQTGLHLLHPFSGSSSSLRQSPNFLAWPVLPFMMPSGWALWAPPL